MLTGCCRWLIWCVTRQTTGKTSVYMVWQSKNSCGACFLVNKCTSKATVTEMKGPKFPHQVGRLSSLPLSFPTDSCTEIFSGQNHKSEACKEIEAVAVRPMLPGNHIKVMQPLNAAFCLQSAASGATETVCQSPETDTAKESLLLMAERNYQIFGREYLDSFLLGKWINIALCSLDNFCVGAF